MYITGRGRRGGETYPEASQDAALAALTNRYLIAAAGPGTPSPFTVASPNAHIVAAVEVTRRASGIFMLAVQMSSLLAAADTQAWAAVAIFGATATGGVPNGQWLLDIASTITPVGGTGDASPMTADFIQSDVGNLQQNVTLVGVNSKPVPQGKSLIIIAGETTGGTQITPGGFFGVAYELP